MRITFFISSLEMGGAERVLSIMANYWASKGWDVTILTMDDGTDAPFFPLHASVTHRPLGIARSSPNALAGFKNNLRRIQILRREIIASRPQLVISFMDRNNVLALLATIGLALPVIVAEHIDPREHAIGRIWTWLRRCLYPRATRIVVLSEHVLSYFPLKVRKRCLVIPNPVVLPAGSEIMPPKIEGSPETAASADPPRLAIAAGRLVEQKGFDMLLLAFAQVASTHPRWMLEIWGEGELRQSLETMRDDLDLRERVSLPGRTSRPYDQMKQADLFILPSRFEGFPTVLCEAMACGLPVVSFDCPTGPREIIRDGVDGVLVPAGDIEGLANAIDRLMRDADERQRLAARATEVLERFGLGRIMARWEGIIAEVVQ